MLRDLTPQQVATMGTAAGAGIGGMFGPGGAIVGGIGGGLVGGVAGAAAMVAQPLLGKFDSEIQRQYMSAKLSYPCGLCP